MTTPRRDLVIRLAFLLVGAHLLAIVAKIDQWPLSHYGMYSGLQRPEITDCVLYGVTAEGAEVRLQKQSYWKPFSASKLGLTLTSAKVRDERQRDQGGDAKPALPGAVAAALDIYESRRAAGKHDGPSLAGLRLYEVTWRIDPELRNLDQPLHRKLLVAHVRDR